VQQCGKPTLLVRFVRCPSHLWHFCAPVLVGHPGCDGVSGSPRFPRLGCPGVRHSVNTPRSPRSQIRSWARRPAATIRRMSAAPAPLRHRPFRHLFIGTTANLLGNGVAPIALAFAVLDATGSLGLVVGAHSLTGIPFLLYGGVLADRLPRGPLLVGSSVVSAASQATPRTSLLASSLRRPRLLLRAPARPVRRRTRRTPPRPCRFPCCFGNEVWRHCHVGCSGGMIFWLIVLGGVVRGERVAVIQGGTRTRSRSSLTACGCTCASRCRSVRSRS
jgi:hypothetical protein